MHNYVFPMLPLLGTTATLIYMLVSHGYKCCCGATDIYYLDDCTSAMIRDVLDIVGKILLDDGISQFGRCV